MSDKQIATIENTEISLIDKDTYSALKNSIFPGAKDESITMVLAYCKARKLDPLQKPVHIVPMWIVDAKTKEGAMRDIVMPGIALYRIQAQRSGQYAGQSDPEFGEDITETLGGVKISYPRWCKIIVKKQMPNGQIVEFAAKEYWKENYATQKKDTEAPNAMWKKRPYAQLAKCAEAQALRKAFPDIIDHTPTAEEMEGKHFDQNYSSKSSILNRDYKLIEGEMLDYETGEVTSSVQQEPMTAEPEIPASPENECPYTFDELKNGMNNSTNLQSLNDFASVISSMKITKEEHAELSKVYRDKMKELKKAE
jgi:phage recombination protein Bet